MSVLLSPQITEKSISKVDKGVYVFKVSSRANKVQVAQEVADLYKVEVKKVNIIVKKPEKKLIRGKFPGKIKGFKKAIVFLKKGQKIPGFEEK